MFVMSPVSKWRTVEEFIIIGILVTLSCGFYSQ